MDLVGIWAGVEVANHDRRVIDIRMDQHERDT
jgi:hypothetical protein